MSTSGYKQGPVISKPGAAGSMVKGQGVVFDTGGKWATPSAGAAVDAILLDDTTDTDDQVPAWQITSGGEVEVKCGGTVTKGARVTPDASGLFVAATSGDITCLKMLADGAANEYVRALVVTRETTA